MPLVRVEVRNEYGLGMPELYTETNPEDPKAVLDGVAVAGIVGILRQLGDLAEFAAEVFHGLQEEVLITSSRSHKLVERVHNIEAALPPLEKAILAQRSHLHFAYTAGSHWHTRLRTEQNHFIYSDLPRCIMDSYEDCRDPPRLHKLDKFDIGGPGACFKRYSDPTYFRRASAGSYEAHLRSTPREKKARRSKKKRTSSRYRGGRHDAPTIPHGGRMDFTSSNFKGKISPSQDVSTINVAPKAGMQPEMDDRLTSFDSRTESGYIECIFRPSYSTQSEDNEAKELSSDSKVQHNSYVDSASMGENSGDPDENIQNSYLAEHSGQQSSYVTWDEKLEIMDSAGQPKDAKEISCEIDKVGTEEKEDLNSGAVDHINFDFHDEPLQTADVGGQPDEIESETDYYMDALNTIESESETDVDCQTKRELKQYPCTNNQVEEGKHKAGHPDNNSVNFEFHVSECTSSSKAISCVTPNSISPESHKEAYSSSNNETSEGTAKLDLLGNNDQVASPQTAGISSMSLTSPDAFESEKVEIVGTNLETITSKELFSSCTEPCSQPPLSEQILSTYESPKPPSSTSGSHATLCQPVMFWTNGGLLGLEPSKPSDFGSPTAIAAGSAAKSKGDVIENSSQKNTMEDNGHVARAGVILNGSRSELSGKLHATDSMLFSREHDINASSTVTPGIEGTVPKDDPTLASKENNICSSRIFEFSNRLLVNGFRRQISLVGDERLAISVRSDVPEKASVHKGYHNVTGKPFREQFGSGSPLMSPSSPPLEHMRISFQPIDGFETFKLKLKFPDGSNNQEACGDMFPSFQLVPEPSLSLHDSGSDSDDDTFCRSSPYASDDCHSHHSESNSEQWDSGDSPRSKDHEQDNAFGRMSSTGSVSSSCVNGIAFQQGFPDPGNYGLQSFNEDGMEPSKSGRALDIPNFDSVNASINQITSKSDGKHVVESCFPNEPTPPPPPLPPLEWRGIKPHPDVTIAKEDAFSEAFTHTMDLTLPGPAVPQQPKPAPLQQDNFVKTIDHTPKGKQPDCRNHTTQNEPNGTMNAKMINEKEDFLQQIRTKQPRLQNTNAQNESNGTMNMKVINEKDDFLHQIRTKSLNLRRTSTTRPTITPTGPNNVQVSAILEKANAIRQAVGSDDGEDDTWSDA